MANVLKPGRPLGKGVRLALSDGLAATVAVAVTTLLAWWAIRLPHATLSLLFLTAVLVTAATRGVRAGLLAGALSFLSYNFLFTTPYFTLKVDDDADVATLLTFLIVAGITGNLAARMHEEIKQRKESLQRISKLFDFGRRMLSATRTDEVLVSLARELAAQFNCSANVLMPEADGTLTSSARAGPGPVAAGADARTAWASQVQEWQPLSGALYTNLVTQSGPVGLVILSRDDLERDALDLAKSFCDQAAIALDRTLLATDLEEARLTTEREQLRSALLSSLSHDLRTPLASVIGATSSVLDLGDTLTDEDRRELLLTALAEGRRLDKYIQNLLDMTRLGQGRLNLERNWVEVHDIVSGALDRSERRAGLAPPRIDIDEDIPLLWVHGALVEQALVNLIDNAVRFSPEGAFITIRAWCSDTEAIIDVCDQGPGIPVSERERVFDMFYTAGDRSQRQGTGLGLAICRGMIAAHAGSVSIHDGDEGVGTRARISLPLRATPETVNA